MLKTYFHFVLKTLFCALLFFVPLLWTPFTRELFEFPKMLTVYFFTAWIFLLFVLKAVFQGELRIKKSVLDLPVLLFLAVYLLSTVFSIHRLTSFYGYYTRFHGGMLSTLCYLLLFYIFITEFKNLEPFIYSILVSALFISGWGILQHFGIDKHYWVQDVQSRVFSTLGQPNWLAGFLAMVIPPCVGVGMRSLKRKKFRQAYLVAVFVFTQYVSFWFTYSLSGLLGLICGMLLLVFLTWKNSSINQKKYLAVILVCFIAFSIVFPGLYKSRIEQLKDILVNRFSVYAAAVEHPGSTTRIRMLVWKGAWQTFLSRPLFGHGPETFAYSFLPHRPAGLNATDEWDFLYNKAHNEYLDLLCNTGISGLFSFVLISALTAKKIYNSRNNLPLLPLCIFPSVVCYLVSIFFGFSVVSTALLFWLFLAFIDVSLSEKKEFRKLALNAAYSKLLIGFSAVFVSLIILAFISRTFWADVLYDRGLNWEAQQNYMQASINMKKATGLNKKRSAYYRDLADNLSQAALTAENNEDAANLASWSFAEGKKAYQLNTLNSLTLKTLTRAYYNLAVIDPVYIDSALELAEKMVSLSPTDPKAYYNLGLVYFVSDSGEEAKEALRTAVELRPQYSDAADLLKEIENSDAE